MKVLCISSEPLRPGNTLPSTFELSQAQIMIGGVDMAILAVSEYPVHRPRLEKAFRWLLSILRPRVHKHVIDGIVVYEGVSYGEADSFSPRLNKWLEAASHAFHAYCHDRGKPDLVHAHGRFLNAGAFALTEQRRNGIPYVYTDHSSFYQRGWAPAEARPILKDVILGAAVYSTVSAALAKAIDRFLGEPVRTAQIFPNVLDDIFESVPPRAAHHDDGFTFISVASLDENKGVDILIKAFARALADRPDCKLDVCGHGPLRESLGTLARDLGVGDRVNFLGQMSKEGVLGRIDGAHALVIASRIETFGVVAIEAMARGRPVISTRCGGPEDIVDDSCGILVPVDDAGALARALVTVAQSFDRYSPAEIRARAIREYGRAAYLRRASGFYSMAA